MKASLFYLVLCLPFVLSACIDIDNSDDDPIVVNNSDEPIDNDPSGNPPTDTSDHYGKNTLNASSPLAVNIAPFAAWTPGWVLIDGFAKTQLRGLAPTPEAATFSLAVREVSTEAQEFED